MLIFFPSYEIKSFVTEIQMDGNQFNQRERWNYLIHQLAKHILWVKYSLLLVFVNKVVFTQPQLFYCLWVLQCYRGSVTDSKWPSMSKVTGPLETKFGPTDFSTILIKSLGHSSIFHISLWLRQLGCFQYMRLFHVGLMISILKQKLCYLVYTREKHKFLELGFSV